MTYQEALDKVTKLLRLSKSNNPHEAALAAARAQEIMDRHNIDTIAVEQQQEQQEQQSSSATSDPITNTADDPADQPDLHGSTIPVWKKQLYIIIAQHNQCAVFTKTKHFGRSSRTSTTHLVGRPADIAMSRLLYHHLLNEFDRITPLHCAGRGISYANNFRLGMAFTIKDRLKEQRQQTTNNMKATAQASGNTTALVHITNAIATFEQRLDQADQYLRNIDGMHMRKASPVRNLDADAFASGSRAGHTINLRPPTAQLA